MALLQIEKSSGNSLSNMKKFFGFLFKITYKDFGPTRIFFTHHVTEQANTLS